jgi:VIT1/CCC1 family predicted Fe2+/Mn2+ transporter
MNRPKKETHFVQRMGWLRAAVLGANDGIISTASLIVGVASAAAQAFRAVEDGATVPIYYESRLARIEIDDDEKPKIDAEIADLTEDEAQTQERLKRKWASVEAVETCHRAKAFEPCGGWSDRS